MGYCMDFNLKGIMKVMWVGRKEIKFADLKGLVKISINSCVAFIGAVLSKAAKKSTANSNTIMAC